MQYSNAIVGVDGSTDRGHDQITNHNMITSGDIPDITI